MKFVCSVCGYVVEAESLAPDFKCPVCKAPASKFNKVEGEMKLAAEHVFGVREFDSNTTEKMRKSLV